MNSRQRIIETLNHREPDVPAIDFGAMRSTGISALAYGNLIDYLGLKDRPVKVYDVFQQLAEPDMDVVDRLGGDVLQVHRMCPSFGISIKKYKPGKLKDGRSCLFPEGYNPVRNSRGEYEIFNRGRAVGKMPRDGLYFDVIDHPMEHVKTFEDIDKIKLGGIGDEELDFIEEQARNLYENTDKALLLTFGGSIYEAGQSNFGFENFFVKMALEKDLLHYWFDKQSKQYLEDLKKILSVAGKYVNTIQFGDDLGTQEAPQISAPMYREMIKPYHMRQYSYVRNNYPHVKVFLHSCGSIFDLIPDLIDAGVEVLNPVQISAKNMDPVRLKREFGKHLTFWGGGANMQHTVNTQSIARIKGEVRELMDIFSPGGGYVFNQVHNIQADISPERIMAIYDTALEYRKKS